MSSVDLPRIRIQNRRNRRLLSRSASGSRPSNRVPAHRRNQPLRERNQTEVVNVELHDRNCIDLTEDHGDNESFIDLTSPTATNPPHIDSPIIVVSGRDSASPDRRRRHRRFSDSFDIENEVEHLDFDIDLTANTSTGSSSDNSGSPVVGSSHEMTVTSPGIRRISCPICMDDYKELQERKVQLMSTICGHIFCKPCIKTTIQTNHACPTCRKRLKHNQVHPIFL